MADDDRRTFSMADVIEQLRGAGLTNVTRHRIGYLIDHGNLPRPPLDAGRRFIFSDWHVARLALLLAGLPSANRPADLHEHLDGGDFQQFEAMH
jgi:hypothetical protein